MTAATKNPSKAAVDAAAQAEADYLAAEREAVAADEHAEALAERVREGDDTVTAEQLDAAQKAGMFARLRAEAARSRPGEALPVGADVQPHTVGRRAPVRLPLRDSLGDLVPQTRLAALPHHPPAVLLEDDRP